MEKSAGIKLEFKDLDTSKRTAVIKHAVYTSIDRVKDISLKGMATKSWQETTPDFLLNHVTGATVGPTKRTFEDNEGGYTEVKFGNWTLGNDTLEMADEGVLKGASYGYKTIKSDFTTIKGQKIRRLLEIKHIETSLLTVPPAHPEAGVVLLNKAFEDIDNVDVKSLLEWNNEQIENMRTYVKQIETYCRKAKASDETIISLQSGLVEYKQIISDYDTLITQLIPEPVSSNDEVNEQLNNFLTSLKLQTWQRQ